MDTGELCWFCGVRRDASREACNVCGHPYPRDERTTAVNTFQTSSGHTIELHVKGNGTRLSVKDAQGRYVLNKSYEWHDSRRAQAEYEALCQFAAAQHDAGIAWVEAQAARAGQAA